MSEKIWDRIDIMTDIETLGTKENVAIIQLSAKAFDIHTGTIIDTFNEFVDLNNADGLKIDGATLLWWLKEDRRDLLAEILSMESKKSLKHVLHNFVTWIKDLRCENKKKYLWGNGILFDNRIIQQACFEHGLDYPIFYRNDRDMRTLFEMACWKLNTTEEELKKQFEDETLVKHNALDDCQYQINVVCYCVKKLLTERVIL
jgi:inhibitor of KinA sporulation pathway (predicted exonuclease)